VDQGNLSQNVPRNMLPCSFEGNQGEVWSRTADWQAFFLKQRAAALQTGTRADAKTLNDLFLIWIAAGHIRDVRQVLTELFYGSCGLRREQRHKVVKEPAILTTHHPTASNLHVRLALPSLRPRILVAH